MSFYSEKYLFEERATLTPIEVARASTTLRNLFKIIEQLPIPVVAAIDGAALGGGM